MKFREIAPALFFRRRGSSSSRFFLDRWSLPSSAATFSSWRWSTSTLSRRKSQTISCGKFSVQQALFLPWTMKMMRGSCRLSLAAHPNRHILGYLFGCSSKKRCLCSPLAASFVCHCVHRLFSDGSLYRTYIIARENKGVSLFLDRFCIRFSVIDSTGLGWCCRLPDSRSSPFSVSSSNF